ncbi:MAG: hypothetical protein O3C63_08640 [Cyanobacteria bacterium]|nr:hypothetical protein [Cyanobacteriota bacterium]MDA1021313.1 hypothetical protein [Cyanobacteriota bacterium]
MKHTAEPKTATYEAIYQDFIAQAGLETNETNVEELCKRGIKKLKLAKHFAKIDDDILNLSLKTEASISFFTGILNLEAKRLRFKEEALKCLKTTTKKSKISAA